MKIEYLKLKNFVNIYVAMSKSEIEIDFKKCKHKIVIFVGDNGTGKTSIQSELHPFATAGSMDVRNEINLIREGHDGLKEIHIRDNEDLYVIKHNYLFNKATKQIKSFISKNGNELNPNGNVTSFKEMVKVYLGLEMDLLILMRLGSNVSNLIDMKSSSRKSFASELFSDIDIYSTFYKNVSGNYRVLRGLIKTVSDKLSKLNIYDENELKETHRTINMRLETKNNEKYKLIEDIAVTRAVVNDYEDKYQLSSIPSLASELRGLKSKHNNVISKVISSQIDVTDITLLSTDSVNTYIDKRKQDISNLIVQTEVNKGTINSTFSLLDLLYKQRESKKELISKAMSDKRRQDIADLLDELMFKLGDDDIKYKDFNIKYDKSKLMFLLSTLQNLKHIANGLSIYSNKAIADVIRFLGENRDVKSISEKHQALLNKDLTKLNVEMSQLSNSTSSGVFTIVTPSNCVEPNCPYINYYKTTNNKDMSTVKTLQDKIKSVESSLEYYESYIDINNILSSISTYIRTNQEFLNIFEDDRYSFKVILGNIIKGEELYDEDFITEQIAVVEDYQEYLDTKADISKMEIELELASKDSINITEVNMELIEIENNISGHEKRIDVLKEINESNEYDIKDVEDDIKSTKDKFALLEEAKLLHDKMSNIMDLLESKEAKKKELVLIEKDLNENNKLMTVLTREIEDLTKKLETSVYFIREFKKLSEEKKQLEEEFEEIEIMKEALSSNKGIPLLQLTMYLRNCTMIINQLLDIVYNGSLEVDTFIINDKEFRIPYRKNGVSVSDVLYSSQGERSFISLILSLALILQTIDKYNIMLLDEVDATLDTKNRQIFINIIEKLMERTNAEQLFLITHNNMFDTYPVDVIQTSGEDLSDNKNINVIFRR